MIMEKKLMTEIKAIFFDIDGTIRSFKTKTIPENTKNTLKKLKEQGIKIFIATGRAPFHIKFLDELLDFEFDGYITINGQYCFLNNGEVLNNNMLSKEDIKNVLPYLKENNIACDFTLLEGAFINLKNERVQWLEKELGDSTRFVIDEYAYENALKEKIYQLNVFVGEDEEEELLKYMPNSKSARWTTHFTDVIPKNGGKNIGIDAIINYFGIKLEETMSFGDGGNDIDMIKHAGIGVAMENGRDDVKEVADFITTSVDNDGITNALKHFDIL
ncbi:Cof-like hydrolase [Gemella bergeri ATCC 700627]|uniref:Cof-like hydrolase n=2 Tax=Gemella bergeri TaxID=84136 RepID=U2QC94_9BACL|nr:Cof-like hydrolase [Gemella bergeri ATCC 700627]